LHHFFLRASVGKHPNIGFTFSERLSRRNPAKKLTDVDYKIDRILPYGCRDKSPTLSNITIFEFDVRVVEKRCSWTQTTSILSLRAEKKKRQVRAVGLMC